MTMGTTTGTVDLGRADGRTRSLAYARTGPAMARGPAVLVIHGIGGRKEDWSGLAAALGLEGRAVYAVDMLGFGASSKDGETITIADQVAALVALMDDQGIARADVVGNSVGGWVAATLAADHPERVGKLVLVDAAGFRAMFEGPPPVNFYPGSVAEMEALLAHVRFDPATRAPGFAQAALAALGASGDAQAAEAVGKGMFASPRLEDVCDRVAAPTLVAWGAEDRLFPPAVADLVAGHVRAERTVLIPLASHFPQLDNPTAFETAVVDFLRA